MGCNSSSNVSVIDIKNPTDEGQNNKDNIDKKEEKEEKEEKEDKKEKEKKEEKEENKKEENNKKKGKKEDDKNKRKEKKEETNNKNKNEKKEDLKKSKNKNDKKEDLKKSNNKTKEEDNKKKDNKEKKEENSKKKDKKEEDVKESVNKKSEEVKSNNKKIEVSKEIHDGVILMKGLEEVIAENLSKNQIRRLVEDALSTSNSGDDKDTERMTEEQIKAIASILYNKIHKKEINMKDYPELKGINVRIGAERLTKDIIRKMLFNNNNEIDEFQIDLTYTNLTNNNPNIKALSIEIL